MPAKKKRRTKSTLRSVGAIFGVMGDLYIPFDLIITAGMERSLAKGTPSSAYNRAQNQLWELYQLLTSFAPGLVAEIAARGPSGLYSVSEELHHGCTAGFNTMTFNVRNAVYETDGTA
ncbi:hypothetical protein OF83DRAFT_1179909 [Amylostereum chailletii]|nr:hypothetical protein OF83DRAFT_1179909 [Amylostereum chailletii]